jgi:hypothetical protein
MTVIKGKLLKLTIGDQEATEQFMRETAERIAKLLGGSVRWLSAEAFSIGITAVYSIEYRTEHDQWLVLVNGECLSKPMIWSEMLNRVEQAVSAKRQLDKIEAEEAYTKAKDEIAKDAKTLEAIDEAKRLCGHTHGRLLLDKAKQNVFERSELAKIEAEKAYAKAKEKIAQDARVLEAIVSIKEATNTIPNEFCGDPIDFFRLLEWGKYSRFGRPHKSNPSTT